MLHCRFGDGRYARAASVNEGRDTRLEELPVRDTRAAIQTASSSSNGSSSIRSGSTANHTANKDKEVAEAEKIEKRK